MDEPAAANRSSLGSRLREARERKGISLRHIADSTKISVRVLEALERDEISRLPGGIFSRAFVRSYAAEVGLDPERAVDEFIAEFPHDSVTAGHVRAVPIDDNEALQSDRQMALAFLKLIGLSVPIIAALLYAGFASRTGERGKGTRAGQAPRASLSMAPNRAAGPRAGAPPARTPTATVPVATGGVFDGTAFVANGLSVTLSASRVCRVSANVDGRDEGEVRLEAGEHRRYDAMEELLLSVSDAGAVRWTVNGQPARSLGTDGVVATVHVTLANFRQFVIAP
jgi:transcriptional regulator with XRE-family HTH domain